VKPNPEKVFAYNKYLGAMQFMSPEERAKKVTQDDIGFTSRRSNDTTTRRFSPDPLS